MATAQPVTLRLRSHQHSTQRTTAMSLVTLPPEVAQLFARLQALQAPTDITRELLHGIQTLPHALTTLPRPTDSRGLIAGIAR